MTGGRQLLFGPDKPDMLHGPYLLFARARMAFGDHFDFTDWAAFEDERGMLWGDDAFVAGFPHIDSFHALGAIPEWVEFIEVASVSPDVGVLDDSAPLHDSEGFLMPSIRNLLLGMNTGTVPEKPCFDRRLAIVTLDDDIEAGDQDRLARRFCRVLGGGAAQAWHGRAMLGIAFRDSRSPAAICRAIEPRLEGDRFYDLGVFKVADVARERGVPSPLATYLGLRG